MVEKSKKINHAPGVAVTSSNKKNQSLRRTRNRNRKQEVKETKPNEKS